MCCFRSAFITPDKIQTYADHYGKNAAKKTLGLQNAIQKCDEYLTDPHVSKYTYLCLYLL